MITLLKILLRIYAFCVGYFCIALFGSLAILGIGVHGSVSTIERAFAFLTLVYGIVLIVPFSIREKIAAYSIILKLTMFLYTPFAVILILFARGFIELFSYNTLFIAFFYGLLPSFSIYLEIKNDK